MSQLLHNDPAAAPVGCAPAMSPTDLVRLSGGKCGDVATFDPVAIERMAALLPAQSKEMVMDVLGISANTWLKIKRGEPIRASIAIGLARRIATMDDRSPRGRA